MKKRFAAVLAIPMLVSAFSAAAGEKVWVGESGGQWNTASNWSPAGVPEYTDIVIFRPGENEKLVVMNGVISTCGGMRFESGETFILTTANRIYINKGTNDVFVAAGAYATVSNAVVSRGENPRTTLRRTGDGTLRLVGPSSWGNDNGKFTAWDFAGGTTVLDGSATTQVAAPATIRSGAVVKAPHDYTFHGGQTDLVIEKGGLLDLDGAGTTYVAGISGEGTITNLSYLRNVQLPRGPYLFSGNIYPKPGSDFGSIAFSARGATIEEESWKIVLGSSNVFAKVNVEFPDSTGMPIGFAPGIGRFNIGKIQGNNTSMMTLEDEDGNPVDVRANFTNPAKFRAKGSGSFTFTSGGSLHQNYTTTDISGMTGTLGSTGAADLNFGNSTEATWPVFDERLSFRCEKVNGQPIYFKAPSTKEVVVPGRISGNGTYGFYGKLTLLDINTEGAWWQVRENADLKVAGGRAAIGGHGLYLYTGSTLTVSNGAYVGAADQKPTCGFDGNVLKQDYGFAFDSGRALGKMVITDGGRIVCKVPTTNLEVKDGGVLEMQGNPENAAGTWLFDGGSLNLNMADAGFNFTVLPTASGFHLVVGPKGMTIRCLAKTALHSGGSMQCYFCGPFEATETGAGGVTRLGCGFFDFWKPMTIRGTFANLDGTLRIPNQADITDATVPLFGTGDFRLGNSRIEYSGDITKAFTARFGTGGKFIYDGAATIRVRESANRPVQTLAFGELTRGGAGAALYFWDNTDGKTYNESGANVTFTEAPATTDDGRIDQPVFTYAKGKFDFASYTADEGLKAFTNYTYGFTGETAGKTVRTVARTETHVTENAEVGALLVDGTGINAYAPNQAQLWIDAGATLTVGSGNTPACVILNNGGSWTPAEVKGAGTLSFGDREGVVVSNDKDANYFGTINVKIAGTRGVTFTRAAMLTAEQEIDIGGDNVYTGGTRIYGLRVSPKCAGAFSSGEVLVGNGELQGGTLYLDTDGLVLTNAVRAAGWGSTMENDSGAIQFAANGTLSGAVEAYDDVRFSAKGGARGTFAGPISGEKVWIWKGAGEVCFAAANTCTGDVEIVGSTLVLKDEGTAGTGDIRLNNGTLVLENSEAKTIANRIYGKGTVRLAGKGAANLPDLVSEDGVGFTLDVATKIATINSLKEIASITTPRTRPTALIVADGDITSYSGTVPENVTLYRPGEYVPPGMTIIVR